MSGNRRSELSRQRPDRRVRRTKQRLKAALLELIAERGYERITIRDLTERADVGRSTFYAHFDSKDDLLFAGFDDWLASLAEPPRGRGGGGEAAEGAAVPPFRFSPPLLEHIREQQRFFRATVLGSSDPRIRRRTIEMLVVPVRRELERAWRAEARAESSRRRRPAPKIEREATVHAVVGAFLGLASWWLDRGERLSVEAVDRLFQETVAAAVHGAAPSVAGGTETRQGASRMVGSGGAGSGRSL